MPVSMQVTPQSTAALTEAELHQVDGAARRLHNALRDFVAALPDEARSASAMARHLGVDRTTCQRAVSAAANSYPGPGLIAGLPGAKALRQLRDAAIAAGVEADLLDALRAATDHLDTTVTRVAGSTSRLVKRIDATPRPGADGGGTGSESAKRRLFESAAELTGRSSEVWFAAYAYWPLAGEEERRVELARINGLLAHIARPDAVPLTFHSFSSKPTDGGATEAPRPLVPNGGHAPIVPQFTTQPLPVVSSKRPGEFVVQAIDPAPSSEAAPIDLVLGSRSVIPHPASRDPQIDEAWAMVNFPVRHLVFDLYLHRDLARACIPSVDAHLWRPDFAQHIGDRWQTRFGDAPNLELLTQGLRNAATPNSPRHAEMTRFLFESVGQDPEDFVGYRCAADYPMWRTGYCVSFDYS